MCLCILYKCLSGSTFSANLLGERVHNILCGSVAGGTMGIPVPSYAALRPGDRHNAFRSVNSH